MATNIIAETIRSTRGKDKLIINGFIYKMNKSTSELQHWVCEKRRHCKARVTTNANLVIIKLNPEEIQNSHTHGPDTLRIEMIKGYNQIKQGA